MAFEQQLDGTRDSAKDTGLWKHVGDFSEILGIGEPPPPPPVGTLTAPSGMTATAVSSTRIDLAWVDNSTGETRFVVDRARDSGFTTDLVTTQVLTGTTTLSVTGLAASTTYYFRVLAANATISSAYSNTDSEPTQAAPAVPPPTGPAPDDDYDPLAQADPAPGVGVILLYVDSAGGSDTTGNGTAALPWQTIDKALKTNLSSQCCVFLRSGTYSPKCGGATRTQYMEFRNYPGEQAVIDVPDPGTPLETRSSFVRFRRLYIRCCLIMYNNTGNWDFQNCKFATGLRSPTSYANDEVINGNISFRSGTHDVTAAGCTFEHIPAFPLEVKTGFGAYPYPSNPGVLHSRSMIWGSYPVGQDPASTTALAQRKRNMTFQRGRIGPVRGDCLKPQWTDHLVFEDYEFRDIQHGVGGDHPDLVQSIEGLYQFTMRRVWNHRIGGQGFFCQKDINGFESSGEDILYESVLSHDFRSFDDNDSWTMWKCTPWGDGTQNGVAAAIRHCSLLGKITPTIRADMGVMLIENSIIYDLSLVGDQPPPGKLIVRNCLIGTTNFEDIEYGGASGNISGTPTFVGGDPQLELGTGSASWDDWTPEDFALAPGSLGKAGATRFGDLPIPEVTLDVLQRSIPATGADIGAVQPA